MKQIVFWQNIPSLHQSPLIKAVADVARIPVFVLTGTDVPEHRIRQGWTRPDFGRAQLFVQPDNRLQEDLLYFNPKDTVHIFSGIHAYPFVYTAFRRAVATPAVIGVYLERQHSAGWKGILRFLRSRMNALLYNARIDFLLAIGELGVSWYRQAGFLPRKIFPFGYFVDPFVDPLDPLPNIAVVDPPRPNGEFVFLFVGQLARHKGLDLLLNALSRLTMFSWSLSIVGDGADREKLRLQAQDLGLAQRVNWLGNLPNDTVRRLMCEVDCLVLPSRYDGWGAVVNEALHAGTPVVCSDACGASELVRIPLAGTVFRSNSVNSLHAALIGRLEKGKVSKEVRYAINRWAEGFSPRAAAEYLLRIVEFAFSKGTGNRPEAPWRVCGISDGRGTPVEA